MNRFQVRRATVDDLPRLRELWELENLPCDVLDKRFGEFQVVHTEQGDIFAAVGFQISDGQGKIHSESIAFAEHTEELRTLLWPRLESMARNNGLSRLWTRLDSPFWKGAGFKKASDEILAALPAPFAEENATWLSLPLASSGGGADSIEKQFAMLKAMSQAENQAMMDRAKTMRIIALSVLALVFAAFAGWVLYYVRMRSQLKKRQTNQF